MTSSLTVPQLIAKRPSTKDQVISILATKHSLSTKELYSGLLKEQGLKLSYQAVHKCLAQLESDGVIIRDGQRYELNKVWISKIKDFANALGDEYLRVGEAFNIKPNFKGTLKFKFDDYSYFCRAMADLLGRKVLRGPGEEFLVGVIRHGWWPLHFDFRDFHLLMSMVRKNKNSYALYECDTPLDRWVAKQYLLTGFDGVKTGVKFSDSEHDILAQGEGIIQVSYSDETKKLFDEIYQRISGLADLFKEYRKQTISKNKVRIYVTITRNPELAKVIRSQIMRYFNGGAND